MSEYRLSEEAQRDLYEIWKHIALDSVERANAYIDRFDDALLILAASPGMGHRRLDITQLPFRFWTVGRHFIIYYESKRPLTVFRVLSARRDISAILSE
jgi:plasmid stabilization system protein ParE